MQKLLLIAFALCISGCALLKECSDDHIKDIVSPDGKYVAAQFRRNCGATTPFVYHINLRESSEEFTYDLNGAMYEEEVFEIDNHKVNLIWKDAKTILIECESCSADQPVSMKRTWKDIRILYQHSRNGNKLLSRKRSFLSPRYVVTKNHYFERDH